ncbi:MAG: hypothetical protein QM490_01310 [Candidatus Gracilibacteria bacterium]
MLPKIEKNLFKDIVKQANRKVFNFKMFIASILFAGTAATASISMPSADAVDNMIKDQQKVSTLVLQPSENAARTYAYHSSHSSHSSHASHYSHRSSSY